MKIFSHRGFHHDVPENTVEAFEAAIALGVDGIETDVRVTHDGQLILFHNPHTPNGTEIHQLTQAEISQQIGYHVPRLGEAIALTQHLATEFCWNLELKARDGTLTLLSQLQLLQPKTKILVTSFWHDAIVEMIETQQNTADFQSYPLEYGLLWANHPYQFDEWQWFEEHSRITTLVFYQERLSSQLVTHCHHKQKRCFTYGDRTPIDRWELANWDIDALITDFPQCFK